jgi:SAM-dependent methyltransferase
VIQVGCPLCASREVNSFHRADGREWLRCAVCDLVFVPRAFHLDPAMEKAQYDLHRNEPNDPGYRAFLGRLAGPLLERLPPGAEVLDFGCGPGPALCAMLTERGHRVRLFDPFYADDKSVFGETYDAVTATEVFEHLAHPGAEIGTLWGCVREGGWLGVMTRFRPSDDRFAGWHYRRDPTHIGLFSVATLHWVAGWLGAEATLIEPDVALFYKARTTA